MRSKKLRTWLIPALSSLILSSAACTITKSDGDPGDPTPPGTVIPATELPADQQTELDNLLKQIEDAKDMTAAELGDTYKVPFTASLSYDPAAAQNLSIIQSSPLALTQDELNALKANGFVISEAKRFPTFVYGYESLYSQDLPLFVSADSILYAVHRSYDDILKAVETASLMGELTSLLGEMRSALGSGGASALGAEARADADVFTAVAASLLTNQVVAPVAGGDAALIAELVAKAQAHEGARKVTLFGVERDMDFSQFKPRGHYTDSPELEKYFKAMMWLGRVDFRMLETKEDGSQVFQRRQVEGALALRDLMGDSTQSRWGRIDGAIQAFVGESDYMTLPELSSLLKDLGVTDVADLASVPDDTIAQAIIDGGYGTQRISSHIMVNGLGGATLPLSSSFALFGQRYVVDSHVFSNVVYDRVQGGKVKRMMPDPLDAAFAALGNNQAGQLLMPQLTQYSYAPDLHAMRLLVDAHPESFWKGNLYNHWLTSLRALSPSADIADWKTAGLPEIATTEAWGRRLLNTQLASWAELRHDTILYAKQSYTGGASCEFPDAYVDPYPRFYQGIRELAAKGNEVVSTLDLSAQPWLADQIPAYFNRLQEVAAKLGEMAEHQRTGTPFTPKQMAFINEAVVVQLGCGDPSGADGWYAELFFNGESGVKFDPTIADVHTQPTDEVGTPVGKVLHVGTGMSRLMVLTVETCSGPRAYAGLVSSYFERVTENYERLSDEPWADELQSTTPADVPWMKDLVVR
ncbi:MAG TPA: DUF3160 domain-containing protein [Polyangiaceae bacterium]|nr:DUF3160 domain-containing protein [Polyangiaceae bacterium]